MAQGMSFHWNNLHYSFSLAIVNSATHCAALYYILVSLDPKHLENTMRPQQPASSLAECSENVHWLNAWVSEWSHPFFDNFEESSDEWLKSDDKSLREMSVLYHFLHFLHLTW